MRTVLLVALVALAGCNRKPAAAPAPPPPATPVTVVKPEKRPVKRTVEQPGTVMPFEEAALQANITGFVGSLADDPDKVERIARKELPEHDRFVDIGSRVKKGQLLAALNIPELDQELKQKESLVRQAEAEVAQAEKAEAAAKAAVESATAAVAEAEAGVDRAQALYERAQKEVERIAKLIGMGVDTSQVRDETQLQFKAAEAGRKEVQARIASARAAERKAEADRAKAAADIDAAKARLKVAEAGVGEVQARQTYTKITAPFDGVVTRRTVNAGDRVSAAGTAPLFAVARIDPVRVVVGVPEADAGLVTVGQNVRLALQSASGPEQTGKVARTSWSLEPGSRTLRTEIDLPNDGGAIRPGTYAHARLTAELPAAWAVPAAAIGRVNDEPVMYLAENGKAVRVQVELLRGDAQFTQVRRYKKAGATDWTEVNGTESVATPAAALSDGQGL